MLPMFVSTREMGRARCPKPRSIVNIAVLGHSGLILDSENA